MDDKFKVVTLCGSTKFKKEFEEIYKKLSLEGNIVLTVACFGHTDSPEIFSTPGLKEMLDDMHKEKIRMSDGIFVINPNNYIGDSTKSEIEFAKSLNKDIQYLENPINKEKTTILQKMEKAQITYPYSYYTINFNWGVQTCIEKLPEDILDKTSINAYEYDKCHKIINDILEKNEVNWTIDHRVPINDGILKCLEILKESIPSF